MKYDVLFETDRILFVKLSELLISEYLKMVNDMDIQKFISHDRKVYSYEEETEWIHDKISKNAIIFSMIEKDTKEFY